LGIKAVIAESYERIHRSNLVGMGVIPLQYLAGQTKDTLGLTGEEAFDIRGIESGLAPGSHVRILARGQGEKKIEFEALVRIDTPVELDYFKHGGILPFVLRNLAAS
jgi:aconitate hydratase